ncbi:hypothetical protein N9Z65_00650 [bacterium]|nr:hypothetical protein [bacterium]
MSKIESIIEFECTDSAPRRDRHGNLIDQCKWTLRKEDVPEIARTIKELLIEEISNNSHTVEEALQAVRNF